MKKKIFTYRYGAEQEYNKKEALLQETVKLIDEAQGKQKSENLRHQRTGRSTG